MYNSHVSLFMQLLEDDDVANERREVLSGEERESDNVVVIRNLSKASTLSVHDIANAGKGWPNRLLLYTVRIKV